MSNGKPLKVLSIAHPAVRRHIGRLRYHPFARDPDVDVHLVVPSSWHEYGRTTAADPGDDPGVTLHIEPIMLRYLPGIKWYAHFYKELGRIVQEVQPDVIHLWEEPWSVVALQAARLKGNAALVLEVDQNLIKKLPLPFEWIRRSVLDRTDLILSRSGEATAVVRAFGFAGPVRSIGYGVDQQMFSPAPSVAKRSEAGLRVGYVGRLVVEKGLDEALNAMVACRAPVSLAIKGEGPYADPLRSRVKELGLEDRVQHGRVGRCQGHGRILSLARCVALALAIFPGLARAVRQDDHRITELRCAGHWRRQWRHSRCHRRRRLGGSRARCGRAGRIVRSTRDSTRGAG